MNKVQQQRLLELADFLFFKVPDENWNYCLIWGDHDEGEVVDVDKWITKAESFECGAVGCAMGWASVLFKDHPAVSATSPNFFGIDDIEHENLFFRPDLGKTMKETTRTSIATRIREFALNHEITDD